MYLYQNEMLNVAVVLKVLSIYFPVMCNLKQAFAVELLKLVTWLRTDVCTM